MGKNVGFVVQPTGPSPFSVSAPVPPSLRWRLQRSDGGQRWSRPQKAVDVTDPCFVIDPNIGRCVEDGWAGARNDLAASPSVDIANGAPTGAGATNVIIDAWADGRDGLNNEKVLVTTKTPTGSWSAPVVASTAGDRGYYAAPAATPTGDRYYLTYNAFTNPFRADTSSSRNLVGVVRSAPVNTNGTPGSWTTLHRGAGGDRARRVRTISSASSSAITSIPRLSASAEPTSRSESGTTYARRPTVRRSTRSAWSSETPFLGARLIPRTRISRRSATSPNPSRKVSPKHRRPTSSAPPTWGNSDIWSFTTAP